jgi:hypothetical protein
LGKIQRQSNKDGQQCRKPKHNLFLLRHSDANRNILRCLLHPATAGACHSSKVVHLTPRDAFAGPDIG